MTEAFEKVRGGAHRSRALRVGVAPEVVVEEADAPPAGIGPDLVGVGPGRWWSDDHVARTRTLCGVEDAGAVADRSAHHVLDPEAAFVTEGAGRHPSAAHLEPDQAA